MHCKCPFRWFCGRTLIGMCLIEMCVFIYTWLRCSFCVRCRMSWMRECGVEWLVFSWLVFSNLCMRHILVVFVWRQVEVLVVILCHVYRLRCSSELECDSSELDASRSVIESMPLFINLSVNTWKDMHSSCWPAILGFRIEDRRSGGCRFGRLKCMALGCRALCVVGRCVLWCSWTKVYSTYYSGVWQWGAGRCLGRCLLSMHLHARACRAREGAKKAANNQCVHGMSCAKNASNSQRMHETVKECIKQSKKQTMKEPISWYS